MEGEATLFSPHKPFKFELHRCAHQYFFFIFCLCIWKTRGSLTFLLIARRPNAHHVRLAMAGLANKAITRRGNRTLVFLFGVLCECVASCKKTTWFSTYVITRIILHLFGEGLSSWWKRRVSIKINDPEKDEKKCKSHLPKIQSDNSLKIILVLLTLVFSLGSLF